MTSLHLTKGAGGHLVKQSGGTHLVKGGGDCGNWPPGTCPLELEVTVSGLNATLLDVCLLDNTNQRYAWKFPSAGGGFIDIDGIYTTDRTIDTPADNYCQLQAVVDDELSSLGPFYYSPNPPPVSCGTPNPTWPARSIQRVGVTIATDTAQTITRAQVYISARPFAPFVTVTVFDTGVIAAALGDVLVNTLYGGIGSMVVELP